MLPMSSAKSNVYEKGCILHADNCAGQNKKGKQYLFSTIREHVWDPYKDITCPNPDI